MNKWKVGDRVQLKASSIRGALIPIGSSGIVVSDPLEDLDWFMLVKWDNYGDVPELVHPTEVENERTSEPAYTSQKIKEAVHCHEDRLFANYAAGRSPTWSCDQRTKDVWCIGLWIDEELTRLNVDDTVRRMQTAEFNRYSRSDQDLWVLAAETLNAAVEGRVDVNRRPHRRWG